jgi:hypothetical protein
MRDGFRQGEPVVYRVSKQTRRPGPRAQSVRPCAHGDDYTYAVEKHWRVVEVRRDGRLIVETRTGKRHVIAATDAQLRRPTWWERITLSDRFPRAPRPDSGAG